MATICNHVEFVEACSDLNQICVPVWACVPSSLILKCNCAVTVAMLPTFKPSGSYKYTSKHVNYMIIRFMLGVLKNQLPPTVTTISQSRRASLLEVCTTSCGNGPEARRTRKELISAGVKSDSQNSSFLLVLSRGSVK